MVVEPKPNYHYPAFDVHRDEKLIGFMFDVHGTWWPSDHLRVSTDTEEKTEVLLLIEKWKDKNKRW